METAVIFRVEDEEGYGPFATFTGSLFSAVEMLPNYTTEVYDRLNDHVRFPSFRSDKAFHHLSVKERKNYKFAFNSEEDLLVAFRKPELKFFHDMFGFKVYKLVVNDFVQSEFQTIFREPIEKVDITEEIINGVEEMEGIDGLGIIFRV